jgi:hypothetical protein
MLAEALASQHIFLVILVSSGSSAAVLTLEQDYP